MRRDKLKKLARDYAAAKLAHDNFKMEFTTPDEELEATVSLLMTEFEYNRMRNIFHAACHTTILEAEKRILGEEDADL